MTRPADPRNPVERAKQAQRWTGNRLARALGVHTETVRRWRDESQPIPPPARAWLECLARYPAAARALLDALAGLEDDPEQLIG